MREIMDPCSMPNRRQGRALGLTFAARLFSAVAGIAGAAVLSGGPAHADTQNWALQIPAPRHDVAVSLLADDRSAFASFSETENFRRVARFPTTEVAVDLRRDTGALDGETREALAALTVEDAEASAEVKNARSEAIADQLTTDVGGVIDGMEGINQIYSGFQDKGEWEWGGII
jgi:hypothetical protein